MQAYRPIAGFKTAADLRAYLAELDAETNLHLPFDEELEIGPEAPLAQPYCLADGFTIGNRFCT